MRERVTAEVAELREHGVTPGLATVLVGDDPASHVYVRMKRKACEEVGIASVHHELGDDASEAELRALLESLKADPAVSGILLQLPLPGHLDPVEMTALIATREGRGRAHPAQRRAAGPRPRRAWCRAPPRE